VIDSLTNLACPDRKSLHTLVREELYRWSNPEGVSQEGSRRTRQVGLEVAILKRVCKNSSAEPLLSRKR